ncbi:acetyl/propionyl/methylcrotonyl-CoA carboxylase subunit alpha [Myxococcus stipitatus]|uniref:acetyl-CoA carboxylase biotin carboxylase subunit n=1 Tax=Myxococcus stipitatus TaxID=83455 RepID=UPI001F3DFCD2|nr:acetyl/propionyl/methylcrotonyl-CoA carboxylase subunit alpha [Myxococcus stipitatus]MCE9667727.1 acetyl/propionyl/methylcrotonyl-CoA carboxylase subunit alpha [Myxococcus stipitatus]
MLESILIANRGEIACRIIRTARRLGIRTVAVYSDADAGARHVRLADEAVRIGPAAARESYLVVENIIDAARKTGARAIHPGYGFLSENPALAEACEAAGIVFVGPSAASIRAMGSKSAAKALMEKAKVPTTPGYHGEDQSLERLRTEAARIGFPILIKASAGGGGKGMRRVDRAEDLEAQLGSCRREALSAFGSDQVLIEKYVERPRHIEVQVFGDTHGNHVFLFERDCSVQRRHQKVLEEAPAPGMTPELRARMGETAVLAAKAVDYVGAGTVEFIADPAGNFYFMEMNTRLQVEHPVTEEVTGLDLVEWQLRVASGERLPRSQDALSLHGHAIEARVYAENPDQGFIPSVGRLVHLSPPETSRNVRVDTGVEQGDEITPFYDPMIAKLIVWGADRDEALRQLREALARYQVVGVANNIEFLGRLARTRSFSQADLDTSLIEREKEALKPPQAGVPDDVWLLGAVAELAHARERSLAAEPGSPWALLDGFRLGSVAPHLVTLRAGEATREVRAEFIAPGSYTVRLSSPGEVARGDALPVRFTVGEDHAVLCRVGARTLHATVVPVGARRFVFTEGRRWELELFDPLDVEASASEVEGGLRAPMPGKVIALLVEPGTRVAKGAPLMVMEAMKMEITIQAPHAGVLASFRHQVGEQVSEGTELAVLEEKAP